MLIGFFKWTTTGKNYTSAIAQLQNCNVSEKIWIVKQIFLVDHLHYKLVKSNRKIWIILKQSL